MLTCCARMHAHMHAPMCGHEPQPFLLRSLFGVKQVFYYSLGSNVNFVEFRVRRYCCQNFCNSKLVQLKTFAFQNVRDSKRLQLKTFANQNFYDSKLLQIRTFAKQNLYQCKRFSIPICSFKYYS